MAIVQYRGPFKVVRELGLERRETVRSLSAVGAGDLREAAPGTRGPSWTVSLVFRLSCQWHCRVAMYGRDNRPSKLSRASKREAPPKIRSPLTLEIT